MRGDEPFSLLLPVHAGVRARQFRTAFASAVQNQTRPPAQVVIVRDGPVPDAMQECVERVARESPAPITLVPLDVHRGLGPALDLGLRACRFDLVARMDADDIAVPTRFERQIPLMRDLDVLGAGLLEFASTTGEIVGRRTPPLTPHDIAAYARAHDPFNHPTVVYRRRAVFGAGGYGDMPLMEDYWLFARMIAGGARAANLQEPLLYYRVDADAYKRRGGGPVLRSEIRLQRQFRGEGFTSAVEYARNLTVRGGYRLLPWQARRAAYRVAVAAYGRRRSAPGTGWDAAGERVPPALLALGAAA